MMTTEELLSGRIGETDDPSRIDDDNAVGQPLDNRAQTALLRPAVAPAICL